ncbi:glycoside hydrolase family 3 C-terminal domain-containing protein [Prolixibacteraceae bacterium Z1-6]|uniref:Glycoside hydrolase family 3 C-terminal domain-containing protein n=1 Tax=Draconibacterium aestuarii TaxID=2998507 RepID=A0A9X3J8H3_9BACT|nr:glycoside hydrolase family 3 C-terminal domain-containing protein [Prolixibacteraceae bacterium Z1-6]
MNRKLIAGVILTLFFINATHAQRVVDMEKKIDEIISQLTLEEKVSMCHAQSKFSSPGVSRLGIPEIWMSDGPHGVRGEINWDNWGYADWTNDYITAFPALTALAASFNHELSHEYGIALGEEARYRKKDILLGPGVNIYRTPLNGRNFEYMGEDPFLASTMVVPYIKGVQENGVAACVKHFALNNQEEWRGHINVNVSDRALYEIYLPAFKAAVEEAEVWSVMGAYNQFRGQHTSHHEILVNEILKGKWGFDGVLITDWGSAHDTKEAAHNGLDIEMGTWTNGLTASIDLAYDQYFLANPFLEMLKSGEIEEAVVDDKVRRILRLMFRTNMNTERPLGRMNNVEHTNVARKVAADGIVLLKNENDFFPFDAESAVTIAVIGENATRSMTIGGGSSELKAKYEISLLEGIQKRFTNANILHSMGYASGPSAYGREIPSDLDADSLMTAAVETAKKADIVLFICGLNKNHYQDCEGGDRQYFNLPFGQNELIDKLLEINSNLGVVLVSGNAVDMPWLNKIKGLIQSWYNGSEAGNALADILSGDVNPSGKLPYSYPVKLNDNAAHYFGELSYPGDSINQYYKEDILVGYRWHDTKTIKPLFAFGYGLSYTSFDIKNAGANKKVYTAEETVKISCIVENTGDTKGAEVIQVYVGKPKSKVDRAVKELKGFDKIYLNAGESQKVEIEIPLSKLAFYDETISDWNIEKGDYKIYLGNASNKIAKELKIKVE